MNWIEYKLLNARTRDAENREQRIQDRLMMSLERGFAIRIARLLQKAANDAAEEVERMGAVANTDNTISWLYGDMLTLFTAHYNKTVNVFGQRMLSAFKSHQQYETKAEDLFAASMQDWISKASAEKVTFVTDTTKSMIQAAMVSGFSEGLTGAGVAKLIAEKTGGAIAKHRSKVISRTETHMASQHASLEAVKSTGIEVTKVWISAEDERTRESHSDVDSSSHENPIGRDEAFVVGADSMLMPGQGSDPAENINCRCVVGFVTE